MDYFDLIGKYGIWAGLSLYFIYKLSGEWKASLDEIKTGQGKTNSLLIALLRKLGVSDDFMDK